MVVLEPSAVSSWRESSHSGRMFRKSSRELCIYERQDLGGLDLTVEIWYLSTTPRTKRPFSPAFVTKLSDHHLHTELEIISHLLHTELEMVKSKVLKLF